MTSNRGRVVHTALWIRTDLQSGARVRRYRPWFTPAVAQWPNKFGRQTYARW